MGIKVDRALDDATYPEEDDHLVRFANGCGKPSAQTAVQKPAVNVKRVKAVLDSKELVDQPVIPLRFSLRTLKASSSGENS